SQVAVRANSHWRAELAGTVNHAHATRSVQRSSSLRRGCRIARTLDVVGRAIRIVAGTTKPMRGRIGYRGCHALPRGPRAAASRTPGRPCSTRIARRGRAALLEYAPRIVGDAAVRDQLERLCRHRRQPRLVARAEIAQRAVGEVDLDLVPLLDLLVDAWRGPDRQADIDRIAREQSPEARRHHHRNAGLLHGGRRLLAARPAAEILPTDDDVAAADFFRKILVDADHQVARH